ncbi:MAG: histidinol-phosphatase HisJ family protein [Clostridia bacterium]|nr:histidinol-phosphatase HisJ family protein [Clostridia bacterium]
MNQTLADMHVHSQNSHDGTFAVVDIARHALENGVSVFAVTDHCDIQYYNEQNVPTLIASSVVEAEQASKLFEGKVKILTGIELGEGLWSKEHTNDILNSFNYDVVIGSVHAVRYEGYTDPYSTIDFSKMSEGDLYKYLNVYFNDVLEMVENVPCDIMAHLTCPLRYINGKYGLKVDSKKYENEIERILKHIIENSIALEINTSGKDFMPDEWIVAKFKELGGYLITIGSDAHVGKNVGKDFDKAIKMLKKYGFDGYYYYENRKSIKCSI